MGIAFSEFAASLAAFLLLCSLVLGGGAVIAAGFRFPGFAGGSRLERAGLSLICGLGCLPMPLDVAGRLGPAAMSAAAVALAAMGAPILFRSAGFSRPHPGWIAGAFIWVILALALVVDMPMGPLHRSFLAFDYVKHAATTWSIAESGTPPWNPTVYEPGRSMAYYYLFYTLPAVVAFLGAPIGVVGRHAAYACAPLAGFGLFALGAAVSKRCGADEALEPGGVSSGSDRWLPALLFATGLDIVPLGILFAGSGGDTEFLFVHFSDWDEQVTSWFNSVMWVPHHLTALCAAFVGFMALTSPDGGWRRIALAGLAFASMAGASVYVGMTAALGALFWLLSLLWRRRFAEATRLCAAGALALALAAPWLLTLAPRFDGEAGAPALGFRLRGPEWIDLAAGSPAAGAIYRGLSMPLFYVIDLGVFGLGAFAFWRRAGRRGYENELGLALICLAIASFLIGSFVESRILFNDLGWRAMLFAQFATLVWTAAAARRGAFSHGALATAANAAVAMGYAATLVAAVHLRLPIELLSPGVPLHDEMAAWRWLDGRLPAGAVVQPRPVAGRAYAYGLYGRFPVVIADTYNGRLFGAKQEDIDARASVFTPIFSDPALSFDDVRARAARYRVAALVVSARDAVFATPGAWTASAVADYANPSFRIYLFDPPSP